VVDDPHSVLFCCDFNAVRSPMAECLMRKYYGRRIFVQSAGVKNELEIDGFAIAVCSEIGVELRAHRVRSFQEMEEWGDQIGAYDLIIALSPAAHRQALEYTRYYAVDVEFWQIFDPTGIGDTRDAKLFSYRQTRDQIDGHILSRFGPPDPEEEPKPSR
jgi:protein-tyrosine-phosphatase